MLDANDYNYLFEFLNSHKNSLLPVVWSCSHYFGNTKNELDRTGKIFSCDTGIHVASVLSNGDIFACPNIPRKKYLIQGNVLVDKFSTVWKNGFEFFRNKDRIKSKKCENCKYWEYCKGDSLHTFDFDSNTQKYCYKEFFKDKISNTTISNISYEEIISYLNERNGKMKLFSVEPVKNNAEKTVIFTPQATKDCFGYFHYGTCHPLNIYEQQVALIGNDFGNISLVKYIVPAILYNRARNMATMDEFCIEQILQEVDIINENMSKSDEIYIDTFGDVKFLGFAHSHPLDTELRFSIHDIENHKNFTNRFKTFYSILLNPQAMKIVCFSGNECKQTKLILLSK